MRRSKDWLNEMKWGYARASTTNKVQVIKDSELINTRGSGFCHYTSGSCNSIAGTVKGGDGGLATRRAAARTQMAIYARTCL